MPRPTRRTTGSRSSAAKPGARPAVDPAPAPARRVSQKSETTRRRLIDAARVVFERLGFTDTRVADVATEAGVSHGTFYTHFLDKTDVFKAVIMAANDELNQEMLTVPGELSHDLRGALMYSNRRFFDNFARVAALHRAVAEANATDPQFRELRIATREEHIDQVTRTVERWQARGDADPDLDARHTAAALVCMLAEFANLAFTWGCDYDLDAMTRTVTTMWLRTVAVPAGDATGQ